MVTTGSPSSLVLAEAAEAVVEGTVHPDLLALQDLRVLRVPPDPQERMGLLALLDRRVSQDRPERLDHLGPTLR